MPDRIRRLAAALGQPGALSVWVLVAYLPVTLLGPVLFAAPGGGVRLRILAGTAGLATFITGAALALAAKWTLRRWLTGSSLSAVVVGLVWVVISAITSSVNFALTEALGLAARPMLVTPGYWLSKAATLLAIAIAVATRESLAEGESSAARAAAAQTAYLDRAQERWQELMASVATVVAGVILPELRSLRQRIPAPTANAQQWHLLGDDLKALARGPVRDLAHELGEQTQDLAIDGSPVVTQTIRTKIEARPWSTKLRLLIRQFPAVHPVSILPALVVLPLQAQLLLSGGGSPFWTAVIIVLGLLGLSGLERATESRRYQGLGALTKWAVAIGGQVILSAIIGWISWTHSISLVTSQLASANPSLWLSVLLVAWTIIGVNMVVGTVAVAFSNRRMRIAAENSVAILQESTADGFDTSGRALRESLVSLLHAQVQGRLIALSLMAHAVAEQERDPVLTGTEIRDQLTELAEVTVGLKAEATTPDATLPITGPLLEVTEAWGHAMTTRVTTSIAPGLGRVPAELATALGRVAAEAIANAAAHAGATACSVHLEAATNADGKPTVTLAISDNGTGLADILSHGQGGSGQGLTEIDRYTGGAWELRPTPEGSRLVATMV